MKAFHELLAIQYVTGFWKTDQIVTLGPGPEPTVRLVRYWPYHFLLLTRPLLVNAWNWHLQ